MGVAKEAFEEVREEVALSRYCHCPGSDGEDNDDMRGEEQDMPYADRDALSRNRRISEGERATSMMAAMANTSTGISGIQVGQIPGSSNDRVHSAMAT